MKSKTKIIILLALIEVTCSKKIKPNDISLENVNEKGDGTSVAAKRNANFRPEITLVGREGRYPFYIYTFLSQ